MQEQNTYRVISASSDLQEDDRDLGFGAKVATESRLRFLNRDGTFNVRRTGFSIKPSGSEDGKHGFCPFGSLFSTPPVVRRLI
ncbi:MAG TPA: hypothetical protein VNI60_05210 [Pyrinomonadaceae bacterium]|nr:hypothetical protein [Pyrinomonadaceae bacterium]